MTSRILIKYFFAIIIITFIVWNRIFRDRDVAPLFDLPLIIIIILDLCLVRGVKISAGKIQGPTKAIKGGAGKTEIPQSDVSGKHKVAEVKSCPDQNQCHKRQCDTTHKQVCPYQQNDPAFKSELAGALTHKILLNKKGTKLSTADYNGDATKGPQLIVNEKTTMSLDKTGCYLKPHAGATVYVQQDDITKKIISSMPPDSPISLKNTSVNDTALDNDL